MNNAVIWIVTQPYFKEAERSLEAVKTYLPNAERVLLTPDKYTGGKFDKVVTLPKRQYPYWYADEVFYFNEALKLEYYKICFLDSDMLAINDCSDIWRGLDRFDLMLAHAPTRQTASPTEELPKTFAEYCTGVMAFRNTWLIKDFFQEWLQIYLAHIEFYKENDQVPLREAMWRTQLPIKISTLTSEWNCRFGLCGSAIKPVRILHGRYDGDMQDVIKMVDTSHGMVTWDFGDLNKLKEQRSKDAGANANNGDTLLVPSRGRNSISDP